MERVNLFYHYSSTAGFIMKTFSYFFFAVFQYKYNMYYVFTTDSQSKN